MKILTASLILYTKLRARKKVGKYRGGYPGHPWYLTNMGPAFLR